MLNRHARVQIHTPARLTEPAADVHVLSVHEETLIEARHLVQGRTPERHQRADDRLYRNRLLGQMDVNV